MATQSTTNRWKPKTVSEAGSVEASVNSPQLTDGQEALTEEDQQQLGKELAAIFKEHEIHPVLIFGSKGSGKTSLIASLIKYMRDREEAAANIELIDDILPENDLRWRDRMIWSRDLFYRKVFAYIDNAAPPTTQEDQPFFVPVTITRSSGEEINVAFLEGKGEWYQPDHAAEVPFKKLKGFLQGLLQNFNAGATVIYVAPFVTESTMEVADSSHLRDSDVGLLGAMNEYLMIRRPFVHQDRHLFLVTKWDVYCESIASETFLDPSETEMQEVLRERYRLSWTRFQNAPISDINQNKAFSTYCAGLISGTNIVLPAAEDDQHVAFYARKLWNWLYENATGKSLYPDVLPAPPGILDRILAWLRA